MIPTITKPLRGRLVYRSQDELNEWFNQELLPFLSQVRQVLNYDATVRQTITTAATGTFTTIWTSADVAVGQTVIVDAEIMGIATGASSAFRVTGLFRNPGTFAQEGATSAPFTQNTAGFAVQFLVSDNHIELQVKDDGALDVSWEATLEVAGIGP